MDGNTASTYPAAGRDAAVGAAAPDRVLVLRFEVVSRRPRKKRDGAAPSTARGRESSGGMPNEQSGRFSGFFDVAGAVGGRQAASGGGKAASGTVATGRDGWTRKCNTLDHTWL